MLRDTGDGAYLVRASKRSVDAYTLCLLFEGNVMNYKLYYDGYHYVAEKRQEDFQHSTYLFRFETLDLLVADGLIALFVEKYAGEYIKKMADEAVYEQSPYSLYNKSNEYLNNKARGSPLQQSHCFVPFTFKMPQYVEMFRHNSCFFRYCDLCKNFLWGLVQQGN